MNQFMDHLANDVLPKVIESLKRRRRCKLLHRLRRALRDSRTRLGSSGQATRGVPEHLEGRGARENADDFSKPNKGPESPRMTFALIPLKSCELR
jgi:hypothetical protein